ncbi:hypothetical protein NW768_012161 [Fusarium equiseti]|uniref:NACHT domain-containing protein n=1 Tax=Fusarium equiseti TaxID=61235 RepID=A0ABQ8QVJ1_FUSEQ|nr:hypothetical protein NW768_012161 [Fusarium equiseti]
MARSDPQPSKVPDTIVVPKISPVEKQESNVDNQPSIADNGPPAVTVEPPLTSNQSEKDGEREKLQEQLWNNAYDNLRDIGNKYMVQYEEILTSELKKDNPDADSVSLGSSHGERWRQMKRLVEIGLSKTEKEARGYEMADSGLELFGTVRALVESAVSAVPQAAIPWSVVNIEYWNGKLKDIEAAEEEFNKRSQQYNTTESRNRLESLVIGVKSIEKAIDRQTKQQNKLNEDAGNRICLQSFYTTNPLYDKKRIEDDKGGLLSHYYSWIFLTEGFQTWQQDPDSKLLWVKGDPGKGKTMLLCGIIDRLDEMSPTCISCFFCQSTRNHQNNATAVLRGLVWSLAHQHPSLISHVRNEFDSAGEQAFNGPNNWEVLSSILRRMISDSSNHVPEGTTIIVDALDECIKDNKKLLDLIVELCSDKQSPVRFIVSSRNWVEFQDAFTKKSNSLKSVILSLEDNEEVRESIKHAVDAFIKHKVEELERVKDTTVDAEVHDIFAEKSGNTFLWVALACRKLLDADIDSWQILETLKNFPSGLTELYRRMLQEVMDSSHAAQCRDILAVSTLVFHPLSLAELSSSAKSLSQHSSKLKDLKRQVLRCKGFLVVTDNAVSFVHQSAKDFLLEDQLAREFLWKAETEEAVPNNILRSHHSILLAMLETMKKVLKYDIYDLQKPAADVHELDRKDAVDPLAPVSIGNSKATAASNKSMYQLEWENISCLVFLPERHSLAAGNMHGNIKLWNLQTKDAQEYIFNHRAWLRAMASSSDGKLLALVASSGDIYLWQVGAKSCLFKLKTEWKIGQISLSSDTRSFITDHGRLIPGYWPSIVESEERTQVDAHKVERDSTEDVDDGNGGDSVRVIIQADEAVDVLFSIEGYGVGFGGAWLTKDGERIIWLPPEHRPSSNVLVTESAVVIRSTSNQLLMFGFKD